MRDLISSVSGVNGYTVTTGGSGSIILTRRYIPTWAIIGGVVGLVFLLIGALLFLVKETETLTITLRPVPGGTELTVSGLATSDLINRITAVVNTSLVPSGSSASSPTTPPTQIAASQIEVRLSVLERMRDAGQITPAEFNEQRQRMISEI